ncbi:hypothetical protein Tco_0130038, partial [Tanacetum coccineum]
MHFNVSLLLTPLCCDDIHEVTPRVSALAGCNRLVSEPKKKFYVEQKAKAKRSKPMTQAQQRDYMSTFIKNQSSWKLSQLKKLSFEELKTKFEKLIKSIESFVPMETEARVKRHRLQLEQETSKK